MKISNELDIYNVIKNTANKKSVSKLEFENIKTKITNLYNSSLIDKNINNNQTINALYQIETNGIRKTKHISSEINKECIQSMINIHNKVDKKSTQIKDYTMLLNSIDIDRNKNNSKTREIKKNDIIKNDLLIKNNELINKINRTNNEINIALHSHSAYFENSITQLKRLEGKNHFEDKQEKYNNERLILSNFIKKNELLNLDKENLSETRKHVDKAKEYDKKSDNIIKGLMDITSIYKGYLDENLKPIKILNAENILNMINDHINKIKEINSKTL